MKTKFDVKARTAFDQGQQAKIMRSALIEISTGIKKTKVEQALIAVEALVRVSRIDSDFFRDLEKTLEGSE